MNPLNQLPFQENFPQPVSIASFQKALTQIFGKEERTGRPWVRVIWAAAPISDRDEYGDPIAFDWDMFGKGGEGEWRRRYLYQSSYSWLEVPDHKTGLFTKHQIWTDISPPRFVIERFIPPDEALRGWIGSGTDKLGDKWTDRRPTNGRYEQLMFPPGLLELAPHIATGVIAEHNGHCCREASKDRLLCWGNYAEPGQVHLDEFQKLRKLREDAKEDRVGEMTPEQFADARRRSLKRDANAFKKAEANVDKLVMELWRTHRGLLSDDPTTQSKGIWHWAGGTSKSGLTEKGKRDLLHRKATIITDK